MNKEFNNFAKFWLVLWVYLLGMQGGGHAYVIAAKLIGFMIPLFLLSMTIMVPAMYLTFKLALWIKPDGGCNGDAQSIIQQMEEWPKAFWNVMKSLCPHKKSVKSKKKTVKSKISKKKKK